MRKVLIKLSLFLPALLLVVVVNYLVDPAYLFKNRNYLAGIAELLIDGKNVANIYNLDERLLQKSYISQLAKPKDVIVLGSSRGMQIGTELFPGKDIFNHSVSGATIEDYLAIYDMYEQKGLPPQWTVLSLDPWVFNKNNGESRWASIKENYYDSLRKQKIPQPSSSRNFDLSSTKAFQLVSFSYFQDSLEKLYLLSKGKAHSWYSATEAPEGDQRIVLSDGTRSILKEERLQTEEQTLQLAKSYVNERPVYHMGSFAQMDRRIINEFESFVRFARSKNTKVIIFLPPYNPYVYDHLIASDQYKIIQDVEKYVVDFAAKEKIDIRGSYNPHVYALTQRDFLDGMHFRREVLGKLFAKREK